MSKEQKDTTYHTVITPKKGVVTTGELKKYKDLIFLFAKRNLTVKYKQTILGPLWLIIMPILSALINTFVFSGIAGMESGNVEYFLFYTVGFTAWSFFASCMQGNSNVFVQNAIVFRKVYFPRLTVPLSNILSSLFTTAIQFLVMIAFMIGFSIAGEKIEPVWYMLWLLPFIFGYLALLGLGMGTLFSALTAKYRDLTGIVPILMELWKYITPVVYISAMLPKNWAWIGYVNPVTWAVETFRYVLLGSSCGGFDWISFLIGLAETAVILALGLFLFKKTERRFVDTV